MLYKTGARGVQQQVGQRSQQKRRWRKEEKKKKKEEEKEEQTDKFREPLTKVREQSLRLLP